MNDLLSKPVKKDQLSAQLWIFNYYNQLIINILLFLILFIMHPIYLKHLFILKPLIFFPILDQPTAFDENQLCLSSTDTL